MTANEAMCFRRECRAYLDRFLKVANHLRRSRDEIAKNSKHGIVGYDLVHAGAAETGLETAAHSLEHVIAALETWHNIGKVLEDEGKANGDSTSAK